MDISRLIESALGGGASGSQAGQAQTGAPQAGPAQAGSGASGMLGQFSSGLPGGLAGGAAAGGLVALMLGNKKARKLGGKVLTYGGLAAAAGLAYKAYSDYRKRSDAPQPQQATPAPTHAAPPPPPALTEAAFDPATAQDAKGGDLRLLLLRAMISAAKADGHIDAAEHKFIWEQVESLSLAADEKAFLFDQVAAPADPIAIAQEARDEAQSSEIYLVSLLAVDVDTQEERRYLERLGDALRLPSPLRAELERQAAAAKAQAEA